MTKPLIGGVEDWRDKCVRANRRYMRAVVSMAPRRQPPPPHKSDHQPFHRPGPIREALGAIVAAAARASGWPVDVIVGPSRKRPLVIVRREIALEALAQGFSFPQIGRALHRDHTTIMSLVGAVDKGRAKVQGGVCKEAPSHD